MTDKGETVAIRAVIHGRVQGVWFRAWTVEEAEMRGLRGWVRNRREGSVEALLIGPPAAVEEMIERCREGPPQALVQRVDTENASDDGTVGFRQLPTA